MYTRYIAMAKIACTPMDLNDPNFMRECGIDYETFRIGNPQMSMESEILVKRIFECLKNELKTSRNFITWE